jgi:hypothetical protein
MQRLIRGDSLKYLLKTLFIIACITMLFSCSRSYDPDEAIDRGDIVDLHGRVTNAEILDSFIVNIQDKKEDKIRITQYTIEGDPIYYNFTFDGRTIKYKYDNSNDKFGSRDVRSTICKKFTKSNEGKMIEYKLEECSGENAEVGAHFSFKIKP